MWVAKLTWRHDCILGNRAKKFNVSVVGYPLEFYMEKGRMYYLHFQKLYGKKENVREFIEDLKKDRKIKNIEYENDIIFFAYEVPKKEKIPTSHYSKKTFFLKPVIVDREGNELWEIASWNRQNLTDFIEDTKKNTHHLYEFKILKIEKTKLHDIYFPQILPKITEHQKDALKLAIEHGYYGHPRKTDLKQLAKQMSLSLSTYREHLRIAEQKVLDGVNL